MMIVTIICQKAVENRKALLGVIQGELCFPLSLSAVLREQVVR